MKRILCWFGFHQFEWWYNDRPWNKWGRITKYDRSVWRCRTCGKQHVRMYAYHG